MLGYSEVKVPMRLNPWSNVARIVSEIVRVIEVTKPLKLDLRDPRAVQELIDMNQIKAESASAD